MKKIKLTLLVLLLFFIGIYFKKIINRSKEVELSKEEIGNFYKEYIITKSQNGIRLKNYFNSATRFVMKSYDMLKVA